MAKGKRRDKSKEVFWKQKLEEHGQSGASIRAFCQRHQLAETAFYFWRREIARRQAERRASCKRPARRNQAAALFVPVRVMAEASPAEQCGPGTRDGQGSVGTPRPCARIEIEWSEDCRIHVTPPVDRQALADVLAVLAEDRAC